MSKVEKKPTDYLRAPYARVVIPDSDTGTYTARILEFPGCVAQGDSVADAYEQLEQAAQAWIRAALDLGQDIPAPAEEQSYSGRVLVRFPKSLHQRAAELAERESTSLNQFVVWAVAERVGAVATLSALADRFERTVMLSVFNQTAALHDQLRAANVAGQVFSGSDRLRMGDLETQTARTVGRLQDVVLAKQEAN